MKKSFPSVVLGLSVVGFCGAFLSLCGCGTSNNRPKDLPPLEPTVIQITQEKTPLVGAMVQLVREDDSQWEWASVGKTDASGSAKVAAKGMYDGAVIGRYKVIVSKLESEQRPDPYAGAPDIKTDFEAYQGWVMKNEAKIDAINRTPVKEFSLVAPVYSSDKTTPLSVEITKGKNRHSFDVGKAVKEVHREVPR